MTWTALAGAAELPAYFAAQCRHFSDDDKLRCTPRLPAAVDPQAFFGREISAAAAEVPRRSAFRTQDRAHSVGGDRRFDPRRKVEEHTVRRAFADLLAAPGDQLVRAAQFLAVVAEHQAALVDQSEGAEITVVARLEAARVIVLAAVNGDVIDSLAE